RACPQDDRGAGGGGPPGAVLREHRGRPCGRSRQRADRVQGCIDLRVPAPDARQVAECRNPAAYLCAMFTPSTPRPVIIGRSRNVRIPGAAAHTGAMAWTACMAVP